MLYNRQRTLSDGNGDEIIGKDPKYMTEEQKITWKVAVQRQYEVTEEYLDQKLHNMQEVHDNIQQTVSDTRGMIKTYNDAVDRINVAALHQRGAQKSSNNTLDVEMKDYMKPKGALSHRGHSNNNRKDSMNMNS